MRQGERNSEARIAAGTCTAGVRTSASSVLVVAVAIGCCAWSALGPAAEGGLCSWYLPLALLLSLLRVGARRDARPALSVALVLLGIGALSARAFEAPGLSSDAGARAELLEP
ncbi:MAG TPA: hypothetical protein VNN80_29785 [Polyangiaceae bacterium]|nr:hypothetical protein [Polyangiaceae bacterium]